MILRHPQCKFEAIRSETYGIRKRFLVVQRPENIVSVHMAADAIISTYFGLRWILKKKDPPFPSKEVVVRGDVGKRVSVYSSCRMGCGPYVREIYLKRSHVVVTAVFGPGE